MEPQAQGTGTDEDGIGMIEIVVAMFVLAVLALAFLPVLTQGLLNSQRNSEIATATQLMSTQLELARSAGSTCSALIAFDAADPADVTVDGREYEIERSLIGACPDPAVTGTVLVDIEVRSDGRVLSTAQTRVFVGGA
ncbi:hypothetical protein [Herbiconiux sp. L3-i23]|uniref:type IV pilus modification PilV family protein n=1 Tax=Herbiconiux sp. L3-i23 TaxID=2905871 RepID=UPI00205C42F3|nr:hypothetical protein [Herbiconiux sp. L3-i23]BDI23916.1 hypothetical protein L3i23_26920 [Herbiconiux sp. L3-i23]